jgi:collagen triple helix repeat protein
MRDCTFLASICLAALAPAVALADDANLVGDAFFANGNSGHFGATATINVGGPSNFQGLAQFDLSTLPFGTTAAQVSNASLRLFVSRIGSPGSVDIFAANGAWMESTVTGTGYPTRGTLIAPTVPVAIAGSFIVVDVTAQVKAWLSGATNNGFLIVADPASTLVYFDTKESQSTSGAAALEVNLLGPTGNAGIAGPTGAMGPIGPTGMAGAIGSAGAIGTIAGPAGLIGPSGPSGPVGAVGAAGAAGPAGAMGGLGLSGPTGQTGAIGNVGPAGPTGTTGSQGSAGPQGPAGVAGLPGPPGSKGPMGLSGPTGATGGNGPVGSAGPAGPQGSTGSTGAVGLSGPVGASGANGAAGATGPQGVFNNTTYPIVNLGNGDHSTATVVAPANTTDHFYILNTTGDSAFAGPYSIQLPPATTVGQVIAILNSNPFTFAFNNFIPSSGDQILASSFVAASNGVANTNGEGPTQGTFFQSAANWARFISDGNHHWYLVTENF